MACKEEDGRRWAVVRESVRGNHLLSRPFLCAFEVAKNEVGIALLRSAGCFGSRMCHSEGGTLFSPAHVTLRAHNLHPMQQCRGKGSDARRV